jgi:hypothetical protein
MVGRDIFLTGICAILCALRDRKRLPMCDEGKEAVNSGKSTVARADGHLPVLLQIVQERKHLTGLQVR